MGCVGKRSEVIGFAGAAEAGVEDWEPLSAHSLPLSFLFFSWDSYILNVNMLDIGEGNGTPLQYSCLENPLDGGAW